MRGDRALGASPGRQGKSDCWSGGSWPRAGCASRPEPRGRSGGRASRATGAMREIHASALLPDHLKTVVARALR
jgi:hypothetical protein